MQINCPVIDTTASQPFFQVPVTAPPPKQPLRWLLELESDGTVRYSNLHPQGMVTDSVSQPVVGSNFFELPDIGDLLALRREFVGFVKGDKNRETLRLMTAAGAYDDSTTVVLTRSFDTTAAGSSSVVVLMELKRA